MLEMLLFSLGKKIGLAGGGGGKVSRSPPLPAGPLAASGMAKDVPCL